MTSIRVFAIESDWGNSVRIRGVTISFELDISTPVKLAITTNNEKMINSQICDLRVRFSIKSLKKRMLTRRNARTIMIPKRSDSKTNKLNTLFSNSKLSWNAPFIPYKYRKFFNISNRNRIQLRKIIF